MQAKVNQDLIVSHLESGLEMQLQGMRSQSVRRGVEGITPAPINRLLGYTPAVRNFELPGGHIKLDSTPVSFTPKNQDAPSPKRLQK
jgi:hypothetical protein